MKLAKVIALPWFLAAGFLHGLTQELSLEDAAEGYRVFDEKKEECRKVVLTPGKAS